MKKIAGVFSILALALGATASFAAVPKVIQLTAPKGSNPANTFTYTKMGSGNPEANSAFSQYKAQNRLSAAMNAKLTAQKKGPAFINGNIDTLPYFNSWYVTGSRNSVYTYSMLGHTPKAGGTTGINNRVLPLIINLTDFNGNVLFTFDPTVTNGNPDSDFNLLLASPIFDATTNYNGTGAAQFTDSIHRAQFSNVMKPNWHTVLNAPQITHVFSVNLDPTAWTFLININTNQIVGEAMDINVAAAVFDQLLQIENANTPLPNSVFPIIQTDAITAFIPGGGCCVLGFHTAETGIANPAGILVWTWTTFEPLNNNIFGGFGADVTVASHEISETFDDPFVNTAVSAWIDGSCSFGQGNLETGDAVEAMNTVDVEYPLTINNYQYHLQNVALLQWFSHNPQTGGPYSWPNTAVLGHGYGPGCTYGQGPSAFFF